MKAGEYFRDWLRTKRLELAPTTCAAYVVYITRHIAPYFDALGKDLRELRPLDIREYVYRKRVGGREDGREGGLSAVSVRKHLNIIKQALRDAVLYDLIPRSPGEPVRMAKEKAREPMRFISLEDAKAALAACRGHALYPLVCVTLYYGLRRSEVLGLRWDAVDFEHGTLQIRHTVTKAVGIVARDMTKTASSMRTFPLLPEVAELLVPLHRDAAAAQSYVFQRESGLPLRPDSVTRGFQRLLSRAGLPHMRFHDLRHATATILFDRGWSVSDVQHWLGHSDYDTTMNVYVAYCRSRPLALGGALHGLFISA